MSDGKESIRALATVTLDARALDELGSETIDRLADLVEARLLLRRAVGEDPLLSAAAAAKLVGVSADTVRRAIRSGALSGGGVCGLSAAGEAGGRRCLGRAWTTASDVVELGRDF